MTLYLKYRPQNISELDLKSVRERLEKMMGSEQDLPAGRQGLPHAWLFSGSRGTGKTSSARILAKYLNCEAKKNKPCNECDVCKSVTDGSCPDVIEIDAASNRGIDEIRELRERVGLSPMQAKYKVYIIDEVHMLTTEAANALLKTLEEPPTHAIFVLCTTEAEKLPDTVRSRCAEVKFGKPTIDEIVDKLEKVAKGEELGIKKQELSEIARAARGSFRDAIKILEQVMLAGGDVSSVIDNTDPVEFLEMNTDEALKFIDNLVEKGINLRGFVEKCVEAVRLKLLETRDVSLISKIEGLERAYDLMRTSAVTQLPLEIYVIESSKHEILNTKQTPNSDEQKTKSAILNDLPAGRQELKNPEKPGSFAAAQDDKVVHGNYKLDDVTAHWSEVMAKVKPLNHSVEALLRSTRPVGFDGRDLVLEAFYEFHKKQLESTKCKEIVEQAVGEVMGTDRVVLKLQLGNVRVSAQIASGDEELVKAAKEIFK